MSRSADFSSAYCLLEGSIMAGMTSLETKSKGRVLVVDDEDEARAPVEKLLRQEHYDVFTASNGKEALRVFEEVAPDIVLSDVRMPEMDGYSLVKTLRQRAPSLPIVVISGFGEVSAAVQAMQAGADDYLTKPVDVDALLFAIQRSRERRSLKAETDQLRRELREKTHEGMGDLLGMSTAMQKVYRIAERVASSRATVLITGESGTGKGALARLLHERSQRAMGPFVVCHCAALSESVLESELFGHEKGSFTGAENRRVGRFEQASGGTLFLDEIGDIPPSIQVKLLRTLQERVIERVGSGETIPVDVRVIAATHRNLSHDVSDGRFREDLYYRLNVVHIEMPPLRARDNDILLLANHFLRKFASDNHKHIDGFSSKAQSKLIQHRWSGNVRELENAIERAVVLCESTQIEEGDLPFEVATRTFGNLKIPGSTMAEIEKYAILTTLESVGGSTAKAADILDISVRTVQYRLHEYGIAPRERKGGKAEN